MSIRSKSYTVRLYSFEDKSPSILHLKKDLSMKVLRRYASKIWKVYGGRKPLPTIVAGEGVWYMGHMYSFCQEINGVIRIELSRGQRSIITLVHELVHALGYDEHDRRFSKKELAILEKCFKINHNKLIRDAKEYRLLERFSN